jgi:very-short-patch-repair endonuclease
MKRHGLKPGAVAKARTLRFSSTAEERVLWQTLRRSAAAARFRRQVPVGSYFVDFVSHSAKLVVELDGGHHAFQQDYDEERTRFLQSEGYRVMRFWNRDVAENLDGVFDAIEAALKKSPSPLVGEGGAKRRMRGESSSTTPHPIPLPQGERGDRSKSAISES